MNGLQDAIGSHGTIRDEHSLQISRSKKISLTEYMLLDEICSFSGVRNEAEGKE